MYGIENLKKIAHLGCGLAMQTVEALADGKFKWTEAFGFVDELMEVPGVLKSWQAIKDEMADLDANERQELYQYICDTFDIPNDNVEAAVEYALKLGINAIALVDLFKAIKK